MLWLKQCIVPSLPKDAIAIEVVYPVVFLAYGRPLKLLPSMVSKLQNELRELATEFYYEDKKKKAKGNDPD